MADMPFIIGEPCIDVMDKSCVDECPVDCIYEGARKLYINPAECHFRDELRRLERREAPA